MTARTYVAMLFTAVAAAALAGVVKRPTAPLPGRVRPYAVATNSALGHPPDLASRPPGVISGSTLWRLFGPIIERCAAALGSIVDQAGDEALLLRLRQAGMFADVPEAQRAQEYRVRQLASTLVATALPGLGLAAVRLSPVIVVVVAAMGFVWGLTKWRGRVDKAITARRERMQVELYTINQLLAMHIRVGGGVVQAINHAVTRGNGAVVGELDEVLRSHRSGRPLTEALEHMAMVTPEPHAARTYRLLATGVQYGADLAEGLRALSYDIRDRRAEALKRAATRRRAAMLLPMIAILAPIMLLFVAAPLPSIVLGNR